METVCSNEAHRCPGSAPGRAFLNEEILRAWDELSDSLEDPAAGNDDVRDAALGMVAALAGDAIGPERAGVGAGMPPRCTGCW